MVLVGPKKKPQDFGFKPGDSHLVANDQTETLKAYNFSGSKLWEVPCLCKGTGGDNWRYNSADTPPGLYQLGAVYNDVQIAGKNAKYNRTYLSYGWISFDMEELENQEAAVGRAGIMLHGGGAGCGWPGAWSPMQTLFPTYGCVRAHNQHLIDRVLPLYNQGRVFLSVYQDQP
jgi:hypothetical protein